MSLACTESFLYTPEHPESVPVKMVFLTGTVSGGWERIKRILCKIDTKAGGQVEES